MFAAYNGHTEIAHMLLTAGAQVNAVNKNGSCALKFATDKGHQAVVNLLVANGATR